MKRAYIVVAAVALAIAASAITAKASQTFFGKEEAGDAARVSMTTSVTDRGSARCIYIATGSAINTDASGNAQITKASEIDATSITYTIRSNGAASDAVYNCYLALGGSSVYPANGSLTIPGNFTSEFNPPLRLRAGDAVNLSRISGTITGATLEVYIHGFVPDSARMDSVSVH